MIGPPCKHGIIIQLSEFLCNKNQSFIIGQMSLYALRNTGAFLVQSQSVSRGFLFHGISAVSALCGFFLKRRMAAYFSSFRMNLQRMPSRHETTYPHSSQIVYLRLWGYASPFTIYGAITGQVSFIFQRFPHSWKRQRGYAHWQGQGPVLFLQKEYGRLP